MGSCSGEYQSPHASCLLLLQPVMKLRNIEVIKKKKAGWFWTSRNIYSSSTLNVGSRLHGAVLVKPALSLLLGQLFLWGAVKSQTPPSEVSFASITTDFLSGLLNCFLLNHLCWSTVTWYKNGTQMFVVSFLLGHKGSDSFTIDFSTL